MKLGLTIVFIFLSIAFTQQQSQFYDYHGKLFADPKYSISLEALDKWNHIESQITADLIKNFKYPPLALENKIQGQSIYEFSIDSSRTVSNIQVIKATGWGIDNTVIKYLGVSKVIQELASKNGETYTYYLPIEFTINDFSEIASPGYLKVNTSHTEPKPQY